MNAKNIYKCNVCGYLYDESKESVAFSELGNHWLCPVCYVDKSEFQKIKETIAGENNGKCDQNNQHVVIIGAGFAGTNLAMEILDKSSSIQVTLITRENEWFYSRPLLTRAFYSDEIRKNMYIMKLSSLTNERLNVLTSTNVTKIQSNLKTLITENKNHKNEIKYDKLVLATGSDAFIPPNLKPFIDQFLVLNTLMDYEQLLNRRKNKKCRLAIIGGGLIGCELASEFRKMNDEVELFHIGDRLIETVLTETKSKQLSDFFCQSGIDIHFNYSVSKINRTKDGYQIDDFEQVFDLVLVAAGFIPRKELALECGIECKRGIKVNEYLETNIGDVYAIGDVAEINNRTYAYLGPINDQIKWLSGYITGINHDCFKPVEHPVKIKIHDYDL